MMVVAADLVLGLLRLEHVQAKSFVGSEFETAFEDKLSKLADTGLEGTPRTGSGGDAIA